MDRILLGLGAAGASLLIIAIIVAWWEHRRHTAELRRQLAWSENTRDMLQAHAKDVEARLSALTASVQAHQHMHQTAPVGGLANNHSSSAAPTTGTSVAAPAQTPSALAAAATAAASGTYVSPWKDTEPMVLTGAVLDFDPTQPAGFGERMTNAA